MSDDGGSLFRMICNNPKDFTRYFVYADLLEEQGKPVEAECWRLLGTFGKYPAYESPDNYYTSYRTEACYWWNCWDDGYSSCDHSVMPGLWLVGMKKAMDDDWEAKGYHSRGQAFTAAVAAYCRAKPKARNSHREWMADMAKKGRTG